MATSCRAIRKRVVMCATNNNMKAKHKKILHSLALV